MITLSAPYNRVEQLLNELKTSPGVLILTCENCQARFKPEDGWRTCPKCMHNHCEMCGCCWHCADDDVCPNCSFDAELPKECEECGEKLFGQEKQERGRCPDCEEKLNGELKLWTLPGSRLQYWA